MPRGICTRRHISIAAAACFNRRAVYDLYASLHEALALVAGLDRQLVDIVLLSLQISLSAAAIAALLGLPIGAWLATHRFAGRAGVVVFFNAMMGLPSVVVGLLAYLLLSRAGPLGDFGILFTPAAMVAAQTVLITPLIVALARQIVADALGEYDEQLRSLRVGAWGRVRTLLWDCRFSLLTAALAGFGRAAAEVGAVMIVGGNIDGVTRVMTTTIALETSKGNLALALGLGLVLVALVIGVNAFASGLRHFAVLRHG